MKKVLLYTLFLVFLGTIRLDAQVTIGDNSEPHPGAILDLKSAKGLKLPVVDISDVTVFQLSADLLNEAAGMMVYNTNNATAGGQGKGIYIWDGGKWVFMAIAMPVASVTVAAKDGTSPTSLVAGSTLQLVATVLPIGVLNKSVTWSVSSGTAATVSPSGLVNCADTGTVVIRATSVADGSKWGEKAIRILPDFGHQGEYIIGSNGTYTTWCWDDALYTPGNICLMTQNSMEGANSATSYNSGAQQGRGYYYTSIQALGNNACPTGWTLPTPSQWTTLANYFTAGYSPAFNNQWMSSALAGCYYWTWQSWDAYGYWYDTAGILQYTNGTAWGWVNSQDKYGSVRCVKSN